MLTAALVSVIYGENDLGSILISALITSGIGALLWFFSKVRSPEMGKREGYFLVAVVWAVYSIFGALPFWLSGYIPSYTDAFFEAISGFTTTGATILQNVEALPHGLLFWRSLTHFIGGVGILVLMIAVLPVYGTGNMMLYQAEYSGANFGSKIKPRVLDTVRRIVHIY
ncbi:MAG: potassium transporter TrkG, partial [Bacteroidales bacterium]|nr:potassium transporter TrkG [Bacteroidales bacterium]